MNKNAIAKMLGVLIMGGAMMAHANEQWPASEIEKSNGVNTCQVEMTLKVAGSEYPIIVCLDKKTDEEALGFIKDARDSVVSKSPF